MPTFVELWNRMLDDSGRAIDAELAVEEQIDPDDDDPPSVFDGWLPVFSHESRDRP